MLVRVATNLEVLDAIDSFRPGDPKPETRCSSDHGRDGDEREERSAKGVVEYHTKDRELVTIAGLEHGGADDIN